MKAFKKFAISNLKIENLGCLTRIILLILFSVTVFSAHSLLSIIIVTLAILGICTVKKVFIKNIVKTVLLFSFLYILGMLPSIIFFHTKFEIFSGVILFFFKTFDLMLSNKIFTTGISPGEVSSLMKLFIGKMKFLRIDIFEISTMIMISLQFFNIIFDQAERLIIALKCRGISYKTFNLVRNIKVIFHLISSIIEFAFCQAENLATALEVRCYGLYFEDESTSRFKFSVKEKCSLGCSFILLGVIIFCNYIKI